MSTGIDDMWTSEDGDQERLKQILNSCAAAIVCVPEGEGLPFNMATNDVFQLLPRVRRI